MTGQEGDKVGTVHPPEHNKSPLAKPTPWGRFLNWLRRTDEMFVLLKGLSVLGIIGAAVATLIGSYFEYKSAQHEKSLTQYKEDFEAATKTFAEVASALQSPMKLQHALFITFSEAVRDGVYTDPAAFLTKSSRKLYVTYNDERLALRKDIDVLARKVEIYIDWASDLNRDPAAAARSSDPLGSSFVLGAYDFDCDKHRPEPDKDFEIANKDKNRPPLKVDWKSAKHHVYSFFYCFEITHSQMRAARQWASESPIEESDRKKFIPVSNDKTKWRDEVEKLHRPVRSSLDTAVQRLSAFNSLAMRRIEQIRLKHQTKGYFCHVIGIWCG